MSLLHDKRRLVIEHQAVKAKYPRAELHQDPDGTLYWHYPVTVQGRVLPVRVVYPYNYPASAPRVYSLVPLPPGCPHTIGGSELCWTDVYSSSGHWRPAIHTAVVALTEVHRWFANMLVWKSLGRWPRRSDH